MLIFTQGIVLTPENVVEVTGLNYSATNFRFYQKQVTEIAPNTLDKYTNLEEIFMGTNQIEEIPEDLFRFNTKLRSINFNTNHLKVLHKYTFRGLTELTTVILYTNRITAIHLDTFRDQPKLTELQLNINYIESLEENTFRQLRALKTLHLDRNRLNEIPEDMLRFNTQLQRLQLHTNSLKIFRKNTLRGLINLKYLALEYNEITELHPDTFIDNIQLASLFLYQNHLTYIPEGTLEHLTQLRLLWFALNPLSNFNFTSISSCKAMVDLQFSSIGIQQFPYQDFPIWFPNLSNVNFSHNQIKCSQTLLIIQEFQRNNITIVGFNIAKGITDGNIYGITCVNDMCPQQLEIDAVNTELRKLQEQVDVLLNENKVLQSSLMST